ncbi:unnamed protein product [Effrenium voratum]|uniref:Acyltransferase 3 domain-containing protein n=1 Tax=Effrenium voratum TaxID=2562239 RepID=A0AA36JQ27_9DINO|nr:unnamed protein product [Effrenium voratum]CAJ1446503.1 unnamed protein product [Effrenium voratum]
MGNGNALRELFHPGPLLRALQCKKSNRLAVLDGVRSLALLWVLQLHAWGHITRFRNCERLDEIHTQWWSQFLVTGSLGVHMFFVLSGLLIAKSYLRLKAFRDASSSFLSGYVRFLLRRFFRIWPMVILAVISLLIREKDAWRDGSGWAYVFLVPNLALQCLTGDWAMLGHLWTIGAEMQMYILTPLVCELLSRRPGLLLGLGSLCCVLLRAFWIYGPFHQSWEQARKWPFPFFYYDPLSNISAYLSGMALCLALEDRQERMPPIRRTVLDLLALAGMLGSAFCGVWHCGGAYVDTDLRDLGQMVIPPIFGWCVARGIFCTVVSESYDPWSLASLILSSKVWESIALLSYAAYVMQLWPVYALQDLRTLWDCEVYEGLASALGAHFATYFLFVFGCLLVAVPCHLLLEMPGIRLGRHLEARFWPGQEARPCADLGPAAPNAGGCGDQELAL